MPPLSPAERAGVYADYARIGAGLHAVDYRAVDLGDFGKPEGYLTRQLDRWTKQYLASKTKENADMKRLISWLTTHLPATDETAIVHGDFRIGNTIIHPTQPRIMPCSMGIAAPAHVLCAACEPQPPSKNPPKVGRKGCEFRI